MIPKFRAWDKRRKEMWKVATLHIEDEYADLFKTNIYEKPFDNPWAKFEDLILMQSTGLKDKNGVEIYEGDIVRRARPCKPEDEIMHIGFANGSFYTTFFPDWCRTSLFSYIEFGNQVEVIGNIYEQPDSTDRTRKTYTILG